MEKTLEILGIAGSLRDDSYNMSLLEAARDLAGDGINVEIADIGDIPAYDADLEAEGDPAPVARFKEKIREADALLIATPEYQHGVPGVLKNALDWASRPPGDAPLNRKPVAVMGATPGSFGTARAQEQLRDTLIYNDCPMVMDPEVLVAHADEKVSDTGEVIDKDTLNRLEEL
ncbi:MAG: NAD(P)H-dependent oxidoreductase, partial [Actinobacteria bacterium]|nr:NAD(P)H-dependent oxidoreductase [Actinomycetota bacterium]